VAFKHMHFIAKDVTSL